MGDTTRQAREIVHNIIASRTVEERFLICAQMYEDAKEFAKVGMPSGLTDLEQERFIFVRLHGLSPEEIVRSYTEE